VYFNENLSRPTRTFAYIAKQALILAITGATNEIKDSIVVSSFVLYGFSLIL
jgi:hypothetical protein